MFQWAFFRPDDDHHELSILGTIFYYGTNIVALPISYALIFLTINVLFQLYNNLTSLEGMSRRTRKAPCIGAVGGEDGQPKGVEVGADEVVRRGLGSGG